MSSAPPPSSPPPRAPAPPPPPPPSSPRSSLPSSAPAVASSPFAQWDARKREVLREYSVTGQISVAASFVVDENGASSAAAAAESEAADGAPQAVSLEKARQRLAALEAQARAGGSVEMTQAQYEQRISKLQKDLTRAWNGAQRVTSLKIAIQCAKLLADPRVPQFYPSMFVLVTEILDTFGRLVFERLRTAAADEYGKMGNARPLPEDFTAADVGAEARETCRNWFYKVACIRELLPRLYIELALLESFRFLNAETDFAQILLRLSHTIRGVANPLVAVYARWYLARMAARLVHTSSDGESGARLQRESAQQALTDYLFTFGEIQSGAKAVPALPVDGQPLPGLPGSPAAGTEDKDAALGAYLRLHSPAVAWLCHQAGFGANKEAFQGVMQQYRDGCGCAMVLKHVLDGYEAAFFAPHAQAIMGMCREAKGATAPGLFALADLYRSMTLALARSPPPEAFRIAFLNEVWKTFTKGGDPVLFARNAAALVELLLSHFSSREVLLLLADLVRRLQAAAAAAAAQQQAGGGASGPASYTHLHAFTAPAAALPSLERLLTLVVEAEVRKMAAAAAAGESSGGASSGGGIVTSEYFGKLLDMFTSEQKPALCRRLLSALVAVPGAITDPVVVNTMFEVARTCHDALDLLTPPEETAAVTRLVAAFLDKVDFGRDLQRQLDVLTDCRQAFTHVDAIKACVIEATLALAGKALRLARGRHTAKTSQFVRALFASVATSIAGLDDPFARMGLAQRAARAALENGCIGQADLLFRAAIQEIPELPQAMAAHIALSSPAGVDSTAAAQEQRLFDLLRGFLAAIVTMPGHPEHGPFYLARGVLNAVQKFPWARGVASPLRCRATLLLLPLLHAFAQDPLPEHIAGVESNDVLYHGDAKYPEELRQLQCAALGVALAQLGEAQQAVQAGDAAARAVVLEAAPDLLRTDVLRATLALDPAGAVPFVEQCCLLLRGLAPEHALVKAAIAVVKEFLLEERKRAALAPPVGA